MMTEIDGQERLLVFVRNHRNTQNSVCPHVFLIVMDIDYLTSLSLYLIKPYCLLSVNAMFLNVSLCKNQTVDETWYEKNMLVTKSFGTWCEFKFVFPFSVQNHWSFSRVIMEHDTLDKIYKSPGEIKSETSGTLLQAVVLPTEPKEHNVNFANLAWFLNLPFLSNIKQE